MLKNINRRKFVAGVTTAATGLFLGSRLSASTPDEQMESSSYSKHYDIMKDVMKYRKIDAHAHIYFTEDSPNTQLDFGTRLGIEKQVISRYLHVMPGNPEEFRKFNDLTIKAIKEHPGALLGGFVLNPIYTKESLDEIERCVDHGMIGPGELYYQVKINDPRYFPVIERMIDLKMIIHSHAECQLGVGGYRTDKYDGRKELNTSIPEDFVDVARRYPEGIFQYAHIGGGGDWRYECKLFQDVPNIYVDTSGSNNDEAMIDFAVEHLGEDRLFYASDNSYYQSVGTVLSSNLTDMQKQKVFFDNYNNVLKKGGRNVD